MRPFIALVIVIFFGGAIPGAQIERATIAVEAPVFIRPGAETALRFLSIGTELRVLQESAGWVEVEFTDSQFGRRVGWVETRLILTKSEAAARSGAPRVEARVVADRPLPTPRVERPLGRDAGTPPLQSPAKLTELLNEARKKAPHIIVERLVKEIDETVRKVSFPDWQSTTWGQQVVRDELRKTFLKHQLAGDQELFDDTYACVREHY